MDRVRVGGCWSPRNDGAMDPNGNIVRLDELTPIPKNQLELVKSMNRAQRKDWLRTANANRAVESKGKRKLRRRGR
jgi:hypothetical protein